MTAGGNGVSFSDLPPLSPANAARRNRKRPLSRLISQDELRCDNKNIRACEGHATPAQEGMLRRVSEFEEESSRSQSFDSKQIPLNNSVRLQTHISALRLEADLYPMRLILSRLMSNPQFNKKGLFNHPVDAEALGLKDYHSIVTKPVDLGTVKSRLHGLVYNSREDVADEIRLVFTNAMLYNPPAHPIHKFAKELLDQFEEYYETLPSCVSNEDKMESGSTIKAEEESLQTNSSTENQAVATELAPIPETGESTASFVASSAGSIATAPPPVPLRRRSTSMCLTFSGPHSCEACEGRTCGMCKQGCLKMEPSLLVCQGRLCCGARVRKGSVYYISEDGSRHYCERCFASLPPVLSQSSAGEAPLYKQDLLKRKNNEELVEDWLTCSKCEDGVHSICAMYDPFVHGPADEYICPSCEEPQQCAEVTNDQYSSDATFTFVSGMASPVPISKVGTGNVDLCSESLEECSISSFIQQKVRERLKSIPNADKTVNVRVISDCSRHFSVPDVIRNHFRMETDSQGYIKPPTRVCYRQKAIAMFQKMDGLDVCVFCMYVQEYDGDDHYDSGETEENVRARHSKRVYIAYIDSVEYFRPRELRTQVYHEILVSYLATARERGYEAAQIWACPPSRGNSFVFWNHPASQRTPTRERLISWYHDALSHSIDCGVVTDVKSLFESEFEQTLVNSSNRTSCGRVLCPPLMEGDFWIEEAVRLHDANISRNLKIRSPTDVCVWHVTPLASEDLDPCPAIQVATLIKDRVMTHPSSVPFRRPVNAAAMRLKDYHKVVTEPMDLGTIYSRCVIGEYQVLQEVVKDVQLMVRNAKKFNPVGHFVYVKADEVLELFFTELASLVKIWSEIHGKNVNSWEEYTTLSMNLDLSLDMPKSASTKNLSVVIEDDRSSDGSRSTASYVSGQASPPPTVQENELVAVASQTPASDKLEVVPRSTGRGRKTKPRSPKLELLEDGSEAIKQSMVGDDVWLLDKRLQSQLKGTTPKTSKKRRRDSVDSEIDDSAPKKRRQSWLGEDLAESVRRLRTSLFMCSLQPKDNMNAKETVKLDQYREYVQGFVFDESLEGQKSSPITETRHGFLELSQFRRFEFNTLRRAKHSTAMMIHHLRDENAPGVVPMCTSCNEYIVNVLWHKVKTVSEKPVGFRGKVSLSQWVPGELCENCHKEQSPSKKDLYIPIPVSLKKSEFHSVKN